MIDRFFGRKSHSKNLKNDQISELDTKFLNALYDSLKSDVLELNAKLRRANEEIAAYNKNIFDLQEPRRKLKKEIFERRIKIKNKIEK